MTGPLARYVRPPRATERGGTFAQPTTATRHRALTQSTRAVTQSVAAVADILRSAKRPAVFARDLMPSRLRRWWWKAGDLAWNVALAFLPYVLATIAIDAVFG